jgi:uncharacterized membrane protein YphA (DoxX/SURF4 family)
MVDPIVVTIARLGLATLLLSAAAHKLRDVAGFRAALDGYALLPAALLPLVAGLVTAAELVLGIGLLLPSTGELAAGGGALLLTVYTAAIVVNLWRGRTRVDCGCAGFAGGLPLSRALVARNGGLILIAVAASLRAAPRTLQAHDLFVIAMAMVTFGMLYLAAETALGNASRWRNLAP